MPLPTVFFFGLFHLRLLPYNIAFVMKGQWITHRGRHEPASPRGLRGISGRGCNADVPVGDGAQTARPTFVAHAFSPAFFRSLESLRY